MNAASVEKKTKTMSFHSNHAATADTIYARNMKPKEIRVEYDGINERQHIKSSSSSLYQAYFCQCPKKLTLFTKYTWTLLLLIYIFAIPIFLTGLYSRLVDTRLRLKATEKQLKLHLVDYDEDYSKKVTGKLKTEQQSNENSTIKDITPTFSTQDLNFWMKDYKTMSQLKIESNRKLEIYRKQIETLNRRLNRLEQVEQWLNDTFGNRSARQDESCGCRGLPGLPGMPGRTGKVGPKGPAGVDGRPGMNGPRGQPGLQGDPGPEGPPGPCHCKVPTDTVGEPGPRGLPGPPGPPGPITSQIGSGQQGPPGLAGQRGLPGTKGQRGERGFNGSCSCDAEKQKNGMTSSYVRWGRSICPDQNNEQIYAGYIGASYHTDDGGGSNYLCMPNSTIYSKYDDSDSRQIRAEIHGVEYEFEANIFHSLPPGAGSKGESMYFDALCTVCLAKRASTVLMVPGTTECPVGWRLEYFGYLMAQGKTVERTEFICVDANAELRTDTRDWTRAGLLNFVETQCGPLPCPPYKDKRELACVVCSS